MSTTGLVVEILVDEGNYRELQQPFKVGSQSFSFTSALVASGRANDLVVVVELKGTPSDAIIVRKILALTRALDVLHSKRPVTAVLTTGQASADIVRPISRVCRVLSVGNPVGSQARDVVRDWLAVLLPLAPTMTTDIVLDWEVDLRRATTKVTDEALLEALITAAPKGSVAVEEALAASVNKSIGPILASTGDSK